MTLFNQYKALMTVLIKDTLNANKLSKMRKAKKDIVTTSRGSASNIAGLGIFAVIMMALIAFYTFTYTKYAIQSGIERELLSALLFASQIVVLFFGFLSTLNFMYFSKDNVLLASLPIDGKVLFAAKFTMSYLSEFFISTCVVLPMLTTYGIVCITGGVGINAAFFFIELITIFLSPLIPLFAVCILSFPIMYVISFFKRRDFWNAVGTFIILVVTLSVYFVMIFGMNSGATENGLTDMMVNTITSIGKIGVYNYLVINALLGIKWGLYLLLYILSIALLFFITLGLSIVFYRKGMSILFEGSGARKGKKINVGKDFKQKSVIMTMINKELKNLVKTPMLLMNSLIALIMVPIMVVIFAKSGMFAGMDGVSSASQDIGMVGMSCYIAFLMMVSTNILSMSAISMEGQNFATLKTLPISVKVIIKSKLVVCNIVNVLLALVVSVMLVPLSVSKNPLLGIGTFICLVTGAFGMSCLGVRTDLKNPNLHYKNINEITKNNKRVIKPMLLAIALGISYMVLGMAFAMVGTLGFWLKIGVFYGSELLINAIILIVGVSKLFNNVDELYYRIEV